MICKKCKTEITGNQVYCPKCGYELRYVPDYNEIDEELNESMKFLKDQTEEELDMKSSKSEKKSSTQLQERKKLSDPLKEKETPRSGSVRRTPELIEKSEKQRNIQQKKSQESDWEEFHLDKQETEKQKKMKLIMKIAGLSMLILVLLISAVAYIVIHNRNQSYSIQYSKAAVYEKSDNFSKAVVAYENAINAAENKQEIQKAAAGLGMLYDTNKDTKNAIFYLEMAVDNGCLETDVVVSLVHLYESQGDSDSIKQLSMKASNNETYSVFEKYLLNQPIFNYKSGTYNEPLTVEITSDDNEVIYYTMDDTPATTGSSVYSAPISVSNGTTKIHAITINNNNLISEEVVVTYQVRSSAPEAPVITPETGNYTDLTKITVVNIPTNCKIYYTLDGTEPTAKSEEYTDSITMPEGNILFKAVAVNEYTKEASAVSTKIYNMTLGSQYDVKKASGYILNVLHDRGEIINTSGLMEDGSTCVFHLQEVVQIGTQSYYIMKRSTMVGTAVYDLEIYYGVNLTTGDVFLAEKEGEGIYNLKGL